jgi:hypothetical protein
MTGRLVKPTEEMLAFREDVLALLSKHAGRLPAEQMLALAGHLVGQCIAFQDQRLMTADRAMAIVLRNIELGNGEAVAGLTKTVGRA